MDPLLYELFTPAHVHFCLGVGPLIASFMFGVLLIECKGYVYLMVCIYPFLSDHTQYICPLSYF